MVFKSIKSQLLILSSLFVLFVAIVLFQIYYARLTRLKQINRLKHTHKLIQTYLKLCEREDKLIEDIRNVKFLALNIVNLSATLKMSTNNNHSMIRKKKVISDNKNELFHSAVRKLKSECGIWYTNFIKWENSVKKWEKRNKRQILSNAFFKIKKRQSETYKKAITLCEQHKFKEAEYLLNIEAAYNPSVHNTVLRILSYITTVINKNIKTSERFYWATAVAIILALIALITISFDLFKSLTHNLNILEQGAIAITMGQFDYPIKISGPKELSGLASAFNDMQNAIRTRDDQIKEDTEEIKKLNTELQKTVEQRNKTIFRQNETLKRKNQELEQILYAASHDLRTPLISIQGFSEELKLSCEELKKEIGKKENIDFDKIKSILEDDITASLNYIINGSKRLEVLLEGLLRLSRMGKDSLRIQDTDMNQLLKNVAETLSFQLNEADAELQIANLENCKCDPSQMEEVFFNLISNAIKYRHPDRKCIIKVYSESTPDSVFYYVEDNGIGIPEAHQEKIFHAFYRVDEDTIQGEGIGLAIVNRAVDLHGGKVSVRSTPGKGSNFCIEIPKEQINV